MKKTHSRLLSLIMFPLLLTSVSSQTVKAQEATVSYQSDGVSYQTFYDQLAPYGEWINDPQYGNVWIPNVAPGFRPYASDGHWVMTDQGNMWVSDAPWAWAAYHYGRWTYNGYYGWIWIPGYQWAPAWVNWRSGGGYYGWAPMGPGQEYGRHYDYPDNYWVFVNPNYLYQPRVYNYYERGDMGIYVHRTEYIRYDDDHGGRRYGDDRYGGRRDGDRDNGPRFYGPRREDYERVSGQQVQVYHVSDAHEAGAGRVGGNEVSIYRPAVNQGSVNTAHPANVMEGRDHPIGNRSEPLAPNHETAPPAFRQEHPQPGIYQSQRGAQEQGQHQQQPQQRTEPQQQQQREQPQQQRGQQQYQPQQQREQQQQQRPQPQQQQRPQQQRPTQQTRGQQKPKQQPQQQEHK